MKIAFLSSTMFGGGSERMVAFVASHWASEGHSVRILTLDPPGARTYELHRDVELLALGMKGNSTGLWDRVSRNARRMAALRVAILAFAPDVVVSFSDKMNVLALAATVATSLPVIVSERIDPRKHPLPLAWAMLRRLLYARATALVVQTQEIAGWAREIFPSVPAVVIPNPVRTPEVKKNSYGSVTGGRIVAMGRLNSQKGFDLLLQAFAIVRRSHPSWSLDVFGEGSERNELDVLAAQLGLRDAVRFRGWSDQPGRELAEADLFVLSSRFEGFPNVLVEAMSVGTPVVSFACPTGPAEIIRPGVDGVVVPAEDVAALGSALDELIRDPRRREAIGRAALDVGGRFSPDSVMAKWEAVLSGAVGGFVNEISRA